MMEDVPLPEFQPDAHPEVVFRAHSNFGRHSILYLGKGEYWICGTWMAKSGSRMVVLHDRLFRVTELDAAAPGLEFEPEHLALTPAIN